MDAEVWTRARRIDPTLKVSREHHLELEQRQVHPARFSRKALFAAMAEGRPAVFTDVPLKVRRQRELGIREAVLENLRQGFPEDKRFRVRLGRDGYRRQSLRIEDLLRRWNGKRGLVNITDLHVRRSKRLIKSIDCSALSDFNLLAGAKKPVSTEEMLTLVVSSAGVFTDSHSDVPDGSNHCFVGKKLWLVWDTFDGIARNLEDIERSAAQGEHAAFNISAFLSVPGSRWFTVEAGQTLFLPGHLTHKVITLEDYLGVGSFFVMLPSYWRTLMRWIEHTPLWALHAPPSERLSMVDKITRRVTRKVNRLAGSSEAEQRWWGLPHLVDAVHTWHRTADAHSLAALGPDSARLMKTALGLDRPASKAYTPASIQKRPERRRQHDAVVFPHAVAKV